MDKSSSSTIHDRAPTAKVKPKVRFSLIWLIPLTAALIGAWLLYKYYTERGTMVEITFDEASGIEEKKTLIKYKNVIVGKIHTLELTDDLEKVKVTAEIFPQMASNLGGNTRFWVVKPRVSIQGVSGLDTLLSGVHIGIDPGEQGEPLELYSGLANAPYITSTEEGTRIALRAKSLGSLDIGSPIFYNKINVGEVTSYRLSPTAEYIDIFAYVHAPYDKRIKSNTRFWNASGIEIELNSAGLSARVEAITSLLIGGIAFETPESRTSKEVNSERIFRLFDSYKTAQDNTQKDNKLIYEMVFTDSLNGLSKDSEIKLSGIKVGKVESIRLLKNEEGNRISPKVIVSLNIDKFSREEDPEEAETLIRSLVADGLVAQLTLDSLITGSQFIALNFPTDSESDDSSDKPVYELSAVNDDKAPIFPTTVAQTGLLNFDATQISQELNKTLASVSDLVSSNDIKKLISGLAVTTESLGRITKQLDDQGFSSELVATLGNAKNTTKEISQLLLEGRSTVTKLGDATNQIQKDASQSMQTFNNVANKLQKDLSVTLNSINGTSGTIENTLKTTLGEDSGLQYKLQLLINDLSEASKSFSALADTLQRKPNSVIFGK